MKKKVLATLLTAAMLATTLAGCGGGSSSGGGGDYEGTFVTNFRRDYTYPIDPATVTALNIGGTRIELSGLEQMPELMN